MNYLIQFQINIYALIILLILYVFMRQSRIKTFGKHLINLSLMTTAMAIIDEPLTWIFDGMQFEGAYFLEYATNFLLYLIGPVIGGLLMSYVDFRLFQDRKRIRAKLLYQHASILTLVILVVNIFVPLYFSIAPGANSYSSGPFKVFHYGVLGFLYGYFFLLVTMNRKRISRGETLIYQIFFSIPIAGMLLQLIDSRLHFSWTSIALGLLVIYVFLESTPSDEDYLTKLYNRNSFDTYMQHLIQENTAFGLMVFDLNDFKEINDRHGHEAGDETLISFAKALKQVFSHDGLAFRLGGDEFAVISETDGIDDRVKIVRERLRQHENPLINEMRFSFGYTRHERGLTADEMSILADKKMYAQKREMKRRESDSSAGDIT